MIGIDAHCHIEFMEDADSVASEVATRMAGAVTSVVEPKYNEIGLQLCKYRGVKLAVGFHPSELSLASEQEIKDQMDFIRSHRRDIVAIGEVGLDYAHVTSAAAQEKTRHYFKEFIALANELSLPLVIHTRNAMDDTLKILEEARVPVIMHFFTGSDEQLREALARNYYISLTTITCVSKRFRKMAKNIPIDNLLLETDAPWLDPTNNDAELDEVTGLKKLTNRPWNILLTAEKLEKELKMTKEDILKKTQENAERVFGI